MLLNECVQSGKTMREGMWSAKSLHLFNTPCEWDYHQRRRAPLYGKTKLEFLCSTFVEEAKGIRLELIETNDLLKPLNSQKIVSEEEAVWFVAMTCNTARRLVFEHKREYVANMRNTNAHNSAHASSGPTDVQGMKRLGGWAIYDQGEFTCT
jgi:hypothetical protein